MTLLKQTSLFTQEQLTSSQADFPVNHTQWQESDSEKKMNAIYGPKCLEQFEKLNHVGLWAKTFSALLVGQGDWFSKRCKLIWKLKATKYKRLYFQLQVSTLHTKDKEPGLLLTPSTKEDVVNLVTFQKRMQKYANGTKMPNLATQIHSLLPTPTCMDGSKNGDMTAAAKMLMGATMRNSGQQIQKTLTDAIHMEILKDNPNLTMELSKKEFSKRTKLPTQMEFVEWIKTISDKKKLSIKLNLSLTKIEHWYRTDKIGFSYPTIEDWNLLKNHYQVPKELDYKMTYQEIMDWKGMLPTPTTRDANGIENSPSQKGKSRLAADLGDGTTSQLNPHFVEEMMGFPNGWTELPFLNGETSQ